jgi:hypothetical protein
MKFLVTKLVATFILTVLLTVFPQTLFSQTKVVGELSLSEIPSAEGKQFVRVNGEDAEDGRSVMSPSEIVTPSSINANINIPKGGSIKVSPNSKLNLTFNSSNISGSLQTGEFLISSDPKVAVNFSTPDGFLAIPVSDKLNSFRITIIDGKTTVYTLLGSTQFNDVVVAAGDYYPRAPKNKDRSGATKSSGNSGLLFVGVGGAIAVGILLALSQSSNDSSSGPISPVR